MESLGHNELNPDYRRSGPSVFPIKVPVERKSNFQNELTDSTQIEIKFSLKIAS